MMKKRFIKLQDILTGEENTKGKTSNILLGSCNYLPYCIDSLLKLIYFIPTTNDTDTNEGIFNSYCHSQYLIAPYSFRSCYILWERGHYSDATIILRSILESIIQIRYLYTHKEKSKIVWTTGDVKIGGMLSSIGVSKDFYKKSYGSVMSGISHRKIAADIFRVNRESTTQAKVIMIPEFNSFFASYVVNNFTALLKGYFNFFEILFPKGYLVLKSELTVFDRYKKSINWLDLCIQQHKEEFPKSQQWYKDIEKIITLSK